MNAEPDITVTVNFHREGAYALPALASLSDLVRVARAAGLVVETQAVLDRADEVTRHIVDVRGRWIDTVEEVNFGDLGLSRNAGTRLARGRFLAFLDGDDLWGEQWLRAAFEIATNPAGAADIIWHPEHLYVFTETEFDGVVASVHQAMPASDRQGFDPMLLVFSNLWSANAFATREIYVRFPYCGADRDRGIGIEDWSWNLETLSAGSHHCVVPGAVHLIRKKGSGSLDQQNIAHQLLPHLTRAFICGLKWPSPR